MIIHDIISFELLVDLLEYEKRSLSRNIKDYFTGFEVFDNDDYLTQEYENGYLKSLTIFPKTHEVFIEFTIFYVCFDDFTLNLQLFRCCKAIGFSVQDDDVEDGYMTVGLLLDSPFVKERIIEESR